MANSAPVKSMWKSEQLLTVIGQASPAECITEARMAALTGFEGRIIESACLKLRKHGLLEKTARGCHKLTAAGIAAFQEGVKLRSGPKGQHIGRRHVVGTVRERAWQAMRILTKGSAADVIMLAAEGGEKDIENNISKYFLALERAGYLSRMRTRQPGTALSSPGHIRWLLVRNSGPLAPAWRQTSKLVYDPNTEEEFKCG